MGLCRERAQEGARPVNDATGSMALGRFPPRYDGSARGPSPVCRRVQECPMSRPCHLFHQALFLFLAAVLPSLPGYVAKPSAADSATGPPDVPPPDAPGPWVVGHTSTTLEGVGAPDRTLPVDVWYPAEPGTEVGAVPAAYPLLGDIALGSDQAFDGLPVAALDAPLLIFSHGYEGIYIQSTALMEALASHGFVVTSAGHTGNTQSAPEDDFDTAASRRVPDVAAVIDWFAAGAAPAADRVDLSRLGVLGHSFGGMTTLGAGAGWAGAPPIDGVGALMPISAVVDGTLQADDRPSPNAGFSAIRTRPPGRASTRSFASGGR
ncbi:MAG TPA: hypothetical protein DFR83_23280, partial [Deltaproteobacteria bacterium]|nr:hypothetical protein [Deltaproteobacteria bacterium]